MKIAIIDCAIESPSFVCFNRLVQELGQPMEYHWPARFDFDSLALSRADRFIVLGSFSNVNERLHWHGELARRCNLYLEQGLPILGICFGHQLMADFWGGTIGLHPEQKQEGQRAFTLNQAVDPWPVDHKLTFVVQHSYEISSLPSCLKTLGSSKKGSHDFVVHRHLPYWGVQGHPEASPTFVEKNFSEPKELAASTFVSGLEFIRGFITFDFAESTGHAQ
jgi:GMP synthase (glutamine-hydrolysing)